MDLLKLSGICPIIADAEVDSAVPAAAALAEAGVPVVEVLMRNEKSRINIKNIVAELPGIQVGAGSVLNLDSAKEAYDLGAKFMVMPGFSSKVIEFCISKNIPVLPGCVTPTEIMKALSLGLNVVYRSRIRSIRPASVMTNCLSRIKSWGEGVGGVLLSLGAMVLRSFADDRRRRADV